MPVPDRRLSTLLDRAVEAGKGLLAWWLGELAALVPAGLRRTLRRRRRLVLYLASTEAILVYEAGSTARELGRIELGLPVAAKRRQSTLLTRKLPPAKLDIVLRLPRASAMRRSIAMPLATERTLRDALGFELERQSPLKMEDIYFDFVVERRQPELQLVQVGLIVVPRAVVQGAVGAAMELGLAPDRVDVASETGPPSGNLLPAEANPAGRRARRSIAALSGLAAALLLAAVYVPLARERASAASLEDQVAAARKKADAVMMLRNEAEQAARDGNFMAERKAKSIAPVELLERLTRLLPDDTWLVQLQASGDALQLAGYSASASGLITRLEGSGSFQKTTFVSPVLQDAKLHRERFQISAQMTGKLPLRP